MNTTPPEEASAQPSTGRRAPGTVRCGSDIWAGPAGLADDLKHLADVGYEAAEFKLDDMQCILGGRLVERAVARVAETCARHADQLVYSVHSPAVLDLRDRHDPALHRDILLCSVRFAVAIGARVLVVHYEARSEDTALEAQYRRAIEEAAALAGRHGLILGIENIEVERSDSVLEFLEAVSHPWVRMTYDFAHDYLAGDLFAYDHLTSARACAPYAAHLHVTDNFGHFNRARLGDFNLYRAIPHANVAITGVGDLHLPIGWGTLPMEQVYAAFVQRDYNGLVISEHDRSFYSEADAEVQARLCTLIGRRDR